jgi:hypothetical protein
VLEWLEHHVHTLPALKLHVKNARAVCTSSASGKTTEARRKYLRVVHEHMQVSEQMGHGAYCDTLILCTKHRSDPPSPGACANWLVGVARLGRPWTTYKEDPSTLGLEASWQGWRSVDLEAYEAGVKCVYAGLGLGQLHMYPIVESVLLPDMIVVAAPRMRDVVHSGCKLVERG